QPVIRLYIFKRRPTLSAKFSGRRVGEGVDDPIDDLLNQYLVFTLAHDANHRLGPRRPDDQPSVPIETRLRVLDGRSHFRVLERLAALVAHILEHLRQRIEAMT